jgi:NAD(P)-dependent dehydrogenase (short-subunit alcohol dehydrogenase family)
MGNPRRRRLFQQADQRGDPEFHGRAGANPRGGIRANAVTPGPIWTPLISSTMSDEAVENSGKQVPMKRPGQPAELPTACVMAG